MAQDEQKMLCFMRNTFDRQFLTTLCRDEWLKIYDAEYVDSLIDQAANRGHDVRDVLEKLEQKVFMAKQKASDRSFSSQSTLAPPLPNRLVTC